MTCDCDADQGVRDKPYDGGFCAKFYYFRQGESVTWDMDVNSAENLSVCLSVCLFLLLFSACLCVERREHMSNHAAGNKPSPAQNVQAAHAAFVDYIHKHIYA